MSDGKSIEANQYGHKNMVIIQRVNQSLLIGFDSFILHVLYAFVSPALSYC